MRTTLTTDPGTTSALFGAGIIPFPIAPSTIAPTSDAARYTFPVTGGRVDATRSPAPSATPAASCSRSVTAWAGTP